MLQPTIAYIGPGNGSGPVLSWELLSVALSGILLFGTAAFFEAPPVGRQVLGRLVRLVRPVILIGLSGLCMALGCTLLLATALASWLFAGGSPGGVASAFAFLFGLVVWTARWTVRPTT